MDKKEPLHSEEKFISEKENKFLRNEYKNKPVSEFEFCGQKFVVPFFYHNHMEEFFDAITSFRDNEPDKYDEYNSQHPNNQINPKKFVANINKVRVYFITPFELRNETVENIRNAIVENFFRQYKELVFQYISIKNPAFYTKSEAQASTKSQPKVQPRTPKKPKNKQPQKDKAKRDAVLKATGKVCKLLGKALKWTAKQTLLTAAGIAGTPFAAAYHFFDKDAKVIKSPKKRQFIEDKILTAIKKGLRNNVIILAVGVSIEINKKVENYKTQKALQESVCNFYGVDNDSPNKDIFYQNFQNIQKYEELIIAAIACPEGYREQAYFCAAGVCTSGYGNTETVAESENNIDCNEKNPLAIASVKTVPVTPKTIRTKEEAYLDSMVYLYKHIVPQFKNINKVLQGTQTLAVCMFIYNTGGSNFSQSQLCDAINNHDSQKYREISSLYRSANGVRLNGLVTRRGLEGFIYATDNVMFIAKVKPEIFGSPDIKYFQTRSNKKYGYLQNKDGTFMPIEYEIVERDAKKFEATNPQESILGILPPSKTQSAILKLGIELDENGNFYTPQSPENQVDSSTTKNKVNISNFLAFFKQK